MPKLTFHQGVRRGDQVVTLDGEDISKEVRSISIRADAGQAPEVELGLLVIEVETDIPGHDNEIRVTQGTTDLLMQYGWTPPQGHVAAKSYTSEELLAEPGLQMAATEVTQRSLAAAFTEWERRYREEPERFMSEAAKLLKQTPETYGDAAAPYLLMILAEQTNGQE